MTVPAVQVRGLWKRFGTTTAVARRGPRRAGRRLTTVTHPTDLLVDLAGKNLAIASMAVPPMVGVGTVFAALTGGWGLLALALGMGLTVLGAGSVWATSLACWRRTRSRSGPAPSAQPTPARAAWWG